MSEVETMAETTFLPIRQPCREVELLKSYNEKLSAPRAWELSAITDSCNAMPPAHQQKHCAGKAAANPESCMKMQAFRNQINPHILLNILECLNGMARAIS